MKAIVRTRYGSTEDLKLEEVPKPVPGGDEVLVKGKIVITMMNDNGIEDLGRKK